MKNSIADLWQFSLTSAAPQSLQQQLHNQIREQILTGVIKASSKMPSSRALAARLGIGRNTVIYAYEQLTAEGYLETRKGAGTYTCPAAPDQLLNSGPYSFQTQTKIGPASLSPNLSNHNSGMPALDQFPYEIWAKQAHRIWRNTHQSHLHHSDPMGYLPLRENIVEYLQTSRDIKAGAHQVMIISGLQQGLYAIAKSLLQPSSHIILEDPGYHGLLASAVTSGYPVHNLPVDLAGATIPNGVNGLLVTSPSRQYPYGYTMPHLRRGELLRWAHETNSLILEDDYDSEFRYSGRPLNSMQGIGGSDHVIYGGTFSKTIFPAFRLGYLILPEKLVEPVLAFRKATDSYPGITNQLNLHAFMETGEFAKHIRRLRKIHSRRHKRFNEGFNEHLSDLFSLMPSSGGLHLLALPKKQDERDDRHWCRLAQLAGIGAAPLSECFRTARKQAGLLLGFADIPDDELEERLKTFSRLLERETDF